MRLPFDRKRLLERSAVHDRALHAHPRAKSPADGIVETIELSEVVLKLARATGAAEHRPYDLTDKARLYVRPLRAVRGT